MMSKTNNTFNFYYNNYYKYVFKMLYNKIGIFEDAEDITQEVFITLLNNINQIHDVKKWLNSAVNYAAHKFIKHNNKTFNYNFENLNFANESRPIANDLVLEEALSKVKCNEVELNMLHLVGMHNTKRTASACLLGMSRRQFNYKYEQLKHKIVYQFKTMGISGIRDFVG